MTTGFILIAAIVILGGVIATVGDRLGTRVGKARLSLFKLRPRNTAVLVTLLTGSIISLSTLAVLFAVDDQLWTGVFELERIQRDLSRKREQLTTTRQQLEAVNDKRNQAERELAQARAEQKAQQIEAEKRQAAAQKRLEKINQSLRAAIIKQSQTQAQLRRTQTQLGSTQRQLNQVSSQFEQAQTRLKTVTQQAKVLRSEIQQSQAELEQLVQQRNELRVQIAERDKEIIKLDREISQRDREIAERNLVIAQREARLAQLEKQQKALEQEARLLEQNLQVLRQGNVAIDRGRVLAAGVVRVARPSQTREAVDQLLREANRKAIQLTQPGVDQVTEQIVKISDTEVEQLMRQISDGRAYLVRILSANNYLIGEKPVRVFADVALNQLIFKAGSVLSAITADPSTMTAEEIRQRVELLLGASKFRAQRAGMVTGETIQIGDNRIQTFIRFFEQLQQYNQPLELKAVAAQDIYTAGPLRVDLVAVQNGNVVFSTDRMSEKLRDILAPTPNPQQPPANNSPQDTERQINQKNSEENREIRQREELE